jgi:hypothetical protein
VVSDESTEVAVLPPPAEDETGLERLQRRPIIDRIEPRTLELIKKTLAVGEGGQVITNSEIGHFLELCANYRLDPFAREAWIAKSKSGKLLIMVGRDGLRKVVNDNGLVMRGATIYASDEFAAEWVDSPADAKDGEWHAHGAAPFTRVTHKRKGFGEDGRGAVVGAWARVYDQKSRVERGYFDAPLSEYMPSNVSPYSPWSKQVSAMMLGAVERQASRQATPLGGLLVDGEQYAVESSATEIAAGEGSGEEPGWKDVDPAHVERIETVLARAAQVEFPGFADRATTQMRMVGQSFAANEEFVAAAEEQIAAIKPAGGEA